MAEPQGSVGARRTRREVVGSVSAPCGACKYLRRKCKNGCIFAPYFSSEQGVAHFAAVHKVFGASNVSKLLFNIPVTRRHEAVATISYEAQARLTDPIFGCVSTILALHQQVASLQAELAMTQNQVMNTRLALANAVQGAQPQPPPPPMRPNMSSSMMQPTYSNNSSASTNLINLASCFNPPTVMDAAPSLEPPQLSHLSQGDEDHELENRIPHVFNNDIFHR